MAEERTGAVTMRGNPLPLIGPELKAGQKAPNVTLVGKAMKPVALDEFKGKVRIIASVPSLDTPVCDAETRRFNEEAGKLPGGVEVLTGSMDLPFAQARWCGAAGVDKVTTLSDWRAPEWGAAGTRRSSGGAISASSSPTRCPMRCSRACWSRHITGRASDSRNRGTSSSRATSSAGAK